MQRSCRIRIEATRLGKVNPSHGECDDEEGQNSETDFAGQECLGRNLNEAKASNRSGDAEPNDPLRIRLGTPTQLNPLAVRQRLTRHEGQAMEVWDRLIELHLLHLTELD